MTRTQIQLPDDVYARARKVCEAREISFAELSRRGLEYMLSVYAPEPAPDDVLLYFGRTTVDRLSPFEEV